MIHAILRCFHYSAAVVARNLSVWSIPVLLGAALLEGSVYAGARQADFNGDGRADLAIGAPGQDVDGVVSAGGVAVLYGRDSNGLSADGDQFWTQDSSNIAGVPMPSEQFGHAVCAGDFNGDGFSDLAVGVILDMNQNIAGGAVNVLYGSATGLRAAGDQLWHRGVDGVLGDLQEDARFGTSLVSGDFDGDGFDDLSVGAPGQDVDGINEAGDVHIFYGSVAGLTVQRNQIFSQNTPGVAGASELEDGFGEVIGCGDFNGDGRDDLVIGVPYEAIGSTLLAGVVHVLFGSDDGIEVAGSQFLYEGAAGVDGVPEVGDQFGCAVSAGDFDGDGFEDLAVGVRLQNVGSHAAAGAVHVFYGSSVGVRTDDEDYWTKDSAGVVGASQSMAYFGQTLAVGDFDNDGNDDLVIAAVGEDRGTIMDAGAVHVLYGSASGLTASGDQLWHQNSSGIRDASETGDYFGSALTAGDYDGDGRDDLAIGVYPEVLSGQMNAGAVNVIYGGGADGLRSTGNQFWHQDSPGIVGGAYESDNFGWSLR